MATHFNPYCVDHEAEGPILRHNGSGVFVDTFGQMGAWSEFLSEHEFCVMRLMREGATP